MKSLKKVFLAFAVVSAMTAATATAAMAADTATYTPDTNTVTEYNMPTIETGKQYTILVVKKGADATVAENIYYIDQEADGSFTVKPKLGEDGKLAEGEYEVRVGGEGVDQIAISTFKVGDEQPVVERKLGDPSGDGEIDVSDAVMAVDHFVEFNILEGIDFKAADADENGDVDVSDAVKIIDHFIEFETLPDKTVTE